MTARLHTLRTSAGALLAFALASPGSASGEADQDQENAEARALDEVVVTGRYGVDTVVTGTKIATPLIEIPQSIAVVSEAIIEERRPATLVEALSNVSGVADSGSRRGFDNLLIRGFTASTSVYLDGLRVERGNFNVAQEVIGLERIEVLKGPGSVLFGEGSLGGVVNQVSKKPHGEAGGSIEYTHGSFGTWQSALDLNQPLTQDGAWAARVIALRREQEDSIDFNGKDRSYLSPSLSWSNGDTTLLLLGNSTRDRHGATYVGLPVEGTILANPNGQIDRSRYVGEPANDGLEVDRSQLGYQIEHRLGERWVARQNARHSDTDVESRATFSSGFSPDFRTLRRGTARFAQSEQATMIDSSLQGRFQGDRLDYTLLLGIDLLRQRIDQTFDFGSFPALDLYNPVYGQPRGPMTPILDFVQDNDLSGLYLQHQLRAGPLTFLLGGRHDRSRVVSDNHLASTTRRQRDSDATWRGGVSWEFRPGAAVFASYAESFNPNFGVDAQGEPFKAETGTQYELGLKTDLADGRLRSTFAVYELTRSNVLVPFPQFPGTQIQTGEQQSRGFEADVALDIAAGWSLLAAYAYTDVEVRKDTNPLLLGARPANVPRQQSSLWASRETSLGVGELMLGAGIRHVEGREGTLPNTYALPDYAVLDAVASFRRGPWRLQLNVYNLFDRNYVESGSPTGTRSVLLGEPASVRASLAYLFD